MPVPAPVLRRRLVGEHLVERHVVRVDVVAGRSANDRRARSRRSLMSAVTAISTTSSPKRRPFGQPPGITPLPKPGWIWLTSTSPPKMLRREKPGSSGLVGWSDRRRQAGRPRREVDLDHIGDEDARDVGAAGLDARNVGLEHELVEQRRQLRSFGVLPEERAVDWPACVRL